MRHSHLLCCNYKNSLANDSCILDIASCLWCELTLTGSHHDVTASIFYSHSRRYIIYGINKIHTSPLFKIKLDKLPENQ